MPSLIVTSGTLAGQVFSFSDSAVIGRGQFSDVRLNDTTVSRRHALIRLIGDSYELSDQDSVNGTRLRGQRIAAPVRIADGDEIEFGEVKAVFRGNDRGESASLASTRSDVEGPTRSPTITGGHRIIAPVAVAPAPARGCGPRSRTRATCRSRRAR